MKQRLTMVTTCSRGCHRPPSRLRIRRQSVSTCVSPSFDSHIALAVLPATAGHKHDRDSGDEGPAYASVTVIAFVIIDLGSESVRHSRSLCMEGRRLGAASGTRCKTPISAGSFNAICQWD